MVGSDDAGLQEAAAGCLLNMRQLAMANERARQEKESRKSDSEAYWFCLATKTIGYSGFECLKIWFAQGLLKLWKIICTKTVTRPFWNNFKDFLVSIDLMEASGVLEKKNKCLGLTGKEGEILVSHFLLLALGFISLVAIQIFKTIYCGILKSIYVCVMCVRSK